jgi:hypothetical protein
MISTFDLAWMAGILDLKGRILRKANRTRNTVQMVLSVDTKEVSVSRKLTAMTGTAAEMNLARVPGDYLRRQCKEHCLEPHVHVSRGPVEFNSWRWTATGAAFVVVLFNVKPYLQVDRGYAEAVNQVNDVVTLEGQGSGSVMDSLQRMLNLGWDMPRRYALALDRRLKLGHSRTSNAA